MKEIWKSIKNFEGYYEVSNFGKIRSVDRLVSKPTHKTQKQCIFKGKIIKQADLSGYKICSLFKNSKGYNIRVHRVVAQAFCKDYFDGCEVHHKDGNRSNNIYSNLICISKIEHLSKHNNGMKKIKKVLPDGEEIIYDGVRLAAKLNNVSHQSIMQVLKGKRPTCVGCKWYYVEGGDVYEPKTRCT